MDKTFIEWVLVKYANEYIEYIGEGQFLLADMFVEELSKDDYEIVGHYDITAVLKYTDSKINYYDNVKFSSKGIHYGINSKGEYSSYMIPLKPLNLFNKFEEKDLLELLLKLK